MYQNEKLLQPMKSASIADEIYYFIDNKKFWRKKVTFKCLNSFADTTEELNLQKENLSYSRYEKK